MEHTQIRKPVRPVDIVAENKAREKIKEGDMVYVKGVRILPDGIYKIGKEVGENPVDTILSNLTPEDLSSTKE